MIGLSSQRSPHANDELYATYPDPLPPVLSNFKPLATDTRKKKGNICSCDTNGLIVHDFGACDNLPSLFPSSREEERNSPPSDLSHRRPRLNGLTRKTESSMGRWMETREDDLDGSMGRIHGRACTRGGYLGRRMGRSRYSGEDRSEPLDISNPRLRLQGAKPREQWGESKTRLLMSRAEYE